MVFEAIPATLGIGIEKVGSPAGGYTTGKQFERYLSRDEAIRHAGDLTARTGGQLVEWQSPESQNVQFGDLPKLYPTRTEYDTSEQAELAGWIHINPSKTITFYKSVKIYCADVTPGRSFGYDLAIKTSAHPDLRFAESSEIWIGQYFSIRFRTGDVVDAIAKIRDIIDANQ